MKQLEGTIFLRMGLSKLCSVIILGIFITGCEDKQPIIHEPTLAKKIEIPAVKSIQASIEKVELSLPKCNEIHCPQIQIYRLISNESKLNKLVDDYIIKYVEKMITSLGLKTVGDFVNTPQIKAESPINSLTKVEQKKNEQQDVSVDTEKNEDFIENLQPSIVNFMQLSQEISALGARSQLNLYIKPKLIRSDEVATVLIDASNYIGGAHGSTSQQYINFDIADHRYLNLEMIVKQDQFGKFNTIVYEKFKTWVSEVDQTLDQETYESLWPFKVSENFYLDKKHLVLQYEQYELGPYAVGLPRIEIPYQELTNILHPKYLPEEFRQTNLKK